MRPSVLENQYLRLKLSEDGSISSLRSNQTGREFIRVPGESRLFRFVLPRKDWEGHYEDNLFHIPRVGRWEKEAEAGLQLDFPNLSLKEGHIEAQCRVILKERELSFHLECTNRTTLCLTEVWFPWLSGLERITAKAEDTRLLVPGFFQGALLQDPYAQLAPSNGWLTGTPGGGRRVWLYPRIMQWVDLFCRDEGLCFAHLDPQPRVKGFLLDRASLSARCFSMAWIRYPHLQNGETFSSATCRFVLHEGDWHSGADIYRRWCRGWVTPSKPPDDVRESIGWHFTFLKAGDGRSIRSYRELPDLFRSARKAGLHILQVFGFHEAGMDRGYPDYRPADSLGGEKKLQEALAQIAEADGRVSLYQSGIAANLLSRQYDEEMETWAVRTGMGEVVRRDWTWNLTDTNHWIREQPFVLMCHSTGWKDLLANTAGKFVRDYGATAVHLDHIGDFDFPLCYADHHGHAKPDEAPRAAADLFRKVKQCMRTADPRAALFCEGLSEISVPWVDVHWGHNSLDRHPEVIRYLFPSSLFTTTVQENQYDRAARAFVQGILMDVVVELGTGSIHRYPEFSAFLLKLALLKTKLRSFLAYGEYLDEKGLLAAQGVLAKVYRSEEGIAAPMVNTGEKRIRARVRIRPAELGLTGKETAEIHSLDGSKDSVSQKTRIMLEPWQPKVMVIRKSR